MTLYSRPCSTTMAYSMHELRGGVLKFEQQTENLQINHLSSRYGGCGANPKTGSVGRASQIDFVMLLQGQLLFSGPISDISS